jgi:hypothetical protein
MEDLNHKQTMEVILVTAILCALFVASSFLGELLFSKIQPLNQPVLISNSRDTVYVPGTVHDTVYFDMCSSCVHFETCIKCQKYEQELIKKGLINP